MHIQPQYSESSATALQDPIRQYPLATFVVQSDELVVNHIPLAFDNVGEHGVATAVHDADWLLQQEAPQNFLGSCQMPQPITPKN